MKRLVVVENKSRWPLQLEGAELVAARDYLTDPRYAEMRSVIVFNVCRAYGYQSIGYYVSLLATARDTARCPRWRLFKIYASPPSCASSPETSTTRCSAF